MTELMPAVFLTVLPGLRPSVLTTAASTANAVVLISHGTGAVGGHLFEAIQEITASGKPVIVLPDNPAERHGLIRIAEHQQVGTLKAGAVILERANVRNQREVYDSIAALVKRGIRGQELAEEMQKRYRLRRKPKSPLETERGLQAHIARMNKIA